MANFKPNQKEHKPFSITGIDSLGQGVSKLTSKVTFIPKTAPGDEGEAIIVEEKKGVAFGRIHEITKASPLRIEPVCPHYSSCPSCHFLHVSYGDELKFKSENLQRMFYKLPFQDYEVIGAPERLGYRNRLQLHYNVPRNNFGFQDIRAGTIVPVPNCLIGNDLVRSEMHRLYENDQWIKEAPANSPRGHVEIYLHENVLKTTWNRPYAEGGFTQVFELMNQKLKDELTATIASENLLDLFAGNGNLSSSILFKKRLCVDLYRTLPGSDFISQDLYDEKALKRISQECRKLRFSPDTMLIDPPRSGLKNLKDWVAEFEPKTLCYVSCDPHTLARDLQGLEGYALRKLYLYDFFPSTFHFETMAILVRSL